MHITFLTHGARGDLQRYVAPGAGLKGIVLDPDAAVGSAESMKKTNELSHLEAFARERIAAHRYPGDYHAFRALGCSACGVVPLELTTEYHTGSKKGDFKGVIWAQCSVCSRKERIFSFTGKHRRREREARPVCKCGSTRFLVAECERIERDEGMLGFFDEGVVVGKCSECGRNQAFVYTD